MEKERSNKKTRAVIITAILLLLIAVVCLCGITFAKYITSKTVNTSNTTVAKWGFIVKANADNLFGAEYSKGEIKTDSTATAVDVAASFTDADATVVAPGTKGSMTFSIEGSAEVMARISVTAAAGMKDVSLTYTKTGESTATVYNPIVWKLEESASESGSYTAVADLTGADLNADDGSTLVKGTLAYALKQAEKAGGDYAPNATAIAKFYKLSWEWTFEDSTVADKDKLDTILGYAKQGAGTYGDYTVAADGKVTEKISDTVSIVYTTVTEIELGLTISVAQVQAA